MDFLNYQAVTLNTANVFTTETKKLVEIFALSRNNTIFHIVT